MRISPVAGLIVVCLIGATSFPRPAATADPAGPDVEAERPEESLRVLDDGRRLVEWAGYAESKSADRIIYVATDGTGDLNCDGTADQEEINEALERVAGDERLTTVHLKGPGTFVVSDTVRIGSNTVLQGDADAVLTVLPHPEAMWPPFKAMIECRGYGVESITVRGFEIRGNRDSFSSDRHYYSLYLANAYDVTVHDMYIHDASGDGVKLQHTRSRFSGTTPDPAEGRWVSIPEEELEIYEALREQRGRSVNSRIYSNRIESVGHDGIYILGVEGVEVDHNYIYNCRTNSNVRFSGCDSFTVHHNVLRGDPNRGHSGNAGIQIQNGRAEVDAVKIHSNRISHKGLGGIIIYGGGEFGAQNGIHVHHNEISDCMIAGIRLFGVHNTLLEHNTLHGNHGDGILYYWVYSPDPRRRPGDPPEGETYSTIVRDNIIAGSLPGPGPESAWGKAGRAAPVSGFGINNCVTERQPGDERPGVALDGTHQFVAERNCIFGNANGPYNHASSETDIHQDPLLVDAEGGDFRLRPDSPCIGAATDGGNIGAD